MNILQVPLSYDVLVLGIGFIINCKNKSCNSIDITWYITSWIRFTESKSLYLQWQQRCENNKPRNQYISINLVQRHMKENKIKTIIRNFCSPLSIALCIQSKFELRRTVAISVYKKWKDFVSLCFSSTYQILGSCSIFYQ